jgi:hypothetical protein
MNLIKSKNLDIIFSTGLIAILFFTFSKLLFNETILLYDDHSLINPLLIFKSISDYFNALIQGYLLDVQPIRDLSFAIDHFIMSYIPFYTYHLTNLFIWILICYLFKKILEHYDQSKLSIWIFVFIFALSPVNSSSIAWIAARKHLLSTAFILSATYITVKTDLFDLKKIILISFLYLFACYSHPINLLWPIWFFIFVIKFKNIEINKNNLIKLAFFMLIIFSITLLINLNYYNSSFINMTGSSKYSGENSDSFSLPLLAFGRYFYLVLFPFDSLPSTHYEGSWQNIVGLVLFPLFIYMILKNKDLYKKSLSLIFLVYFFIPLIPVCYKITNIFCSDTYVLNASIGIYLIIYINIKNYIPRIKYFIIFYTLFLIYYNYQYVKIFNSDYELWEYSYKKEATPISTINLAQYYTKAHKFKEADELILRTKIWQPNNYRRIIAAINNIYYNTDISNTEKINSLENFKPLTKLTMLYLSILYSKENQSQKVQNLIPQLLNNPASYFMFFSDRNEEILAMYLTLCEKENIKNCTDSVIQLKKTIIMPFWDEIKFQKFKEKYKEKFYKNLDLEMY